MNSTMPPNHFKPQTCRAQLRVVQAIDSAERAMIPAGFDAEALALDAMHFQAAATPLAHDTGSVTRLHDQVQRADAKRRLETLAQLPLAPLDQQHRAVVARFKPISTDPLLLNTGAPLLRRVSQPPKQPTAAPVDKSLPAQALDSMKERMQREYSATTASERRSIVFLVAVFLGAIVAIVAIPLIARG